MKPIISDEFCNCTKDLFHRESLMQNGQVTILMERSAKK